MFEQARADYFRWHNADDLIEPTSHERCNEVLENNRDAVLSYGKTVIIDDLGNQIKPYDDNLDLQERSASDRFIGFYNRVGLTNVVFGLMRADAMRKTNLFGDGSLPAVDYKFMAELTLHGTFVEIPEVLFYRRMHPASSSWDRKDKERQQKFWKASVGDFEFPETRLNWSYLKSIQALQTSFSEKFRLTLFIGRRIIGHRGKIASELYQFMRGLFSSKSS